MRGVFQSSLEDGIKSATQGTSDSCSVQIFYSRGGELAKWFYNEHCISVPPSLELKAFPKSKTWYCPEFVGANLS